MLKKTASYNSETQNQLADKLRKCRKKAGLTMQFVADNAGLSVGFISQVERAITVPSLSSLRSIAGVLGKPISHFLEQPSTEVETTREVSRVNYSIGKNALSYERLSANFPGCSIRSVIVHEPPGHRNEPISHDGEELFYMLDGEVTVELEGARTVLQRGDSMHFDSRKTHSTWNHTDKTVSMLWCGTMDVFGEGTPNPMHNGTSKNNKTKTNVQGENK